MKNDLREKMASISIEKLEDRKEFCFYILCCPIPCCPTHHPTDPDTPDPGEGGETFARK